MSTSARAPPYWKLLHDWIVTTSGFMNCHNALLTNIYMWSDCQKTPTIKKHNLNHLFISSTKQPVPGSISWWSDYAGGQTQTNMISKYVIIWHCIQNKSLPLSWSIFRWELQITTLIYKLCQQIWFTSDMVANGDFPWGDISLAPIGPLNKLFAAPSWQQWWLYRCIKCEQETVFERILIYDECLKISLIVLCPRECIVSSSDVM